VNENEVSAPTAIAVLEYLAKSLVDDPDAVQVDADDTKGARIELSVRVSPPDVGRLIGKRGRVANSIRTIVRASTPCSPSFWSGRRSSALTSSAV
jgi:predicted RNA-binding protein YlqC (UPF0109 family)